MNSLLTTWSASACQEADRPCTVEALYDALFAPYQRLRIVSFEALVWQMCFKRYDRPGALQLIDPDFHCWEQWNELQHLLHASRCCWMLKIPREMECRFAEIADLPSVFRYEGPDDILWFIAASPLEPS